MTSNLRVQAAGEYGNGAAKNDIQEPRKTLESSPQQLKGYIHKRDHTPCRLQAKSFEAFTDCKKKNVWFKLKADYAQKNWDFHCWDCNDRLRFKNGTKNKQWLVDFSEETNPCSRRLCSKCCANPRLQCHQYRQQWRRKQTSTLQSFPRPSAWPATAIWQTHAEKR